MKSTTAKHAEVTPSGVRKRGKTKGTQTPVVVKQTTTGKLKQYLLYGGTTIMAVALAIGIAEDWTPNMVHIAYPLGFVYLVQMLLIRLSKLE